MIASLPPRQEHTEHWMGVFHAHRRLVRAKIRAELSSGRPGTRHRMAHLIARAANIDGQILAAEARS